MLLLNLVWLALWSRADPALGWRPERLQRVPGAVERIRERLRKAVADRDDQGMARSLADLEDIIPVLREYSDSGEINQDAARMLEDIAARLDSIKGDGRFKRGALPSCLNDSYLMGKTSQKTQHAPSITEVPLRDLVMSVSENVNRLHSIVLFLIGTLTIGVVAYTTYKLLSRSPKKTSSCHMSEACVSSINSPRNIGDLNIDKAPDILFKTNCNITPHLTESERRLDLSLDEMSDRLYMLENQAKSLYHMCIDNEYSENDGECSIDEDLHTFQ